MKKFVIGLLIILILLPAFYAWSAQGPDCSINLGPCAKTAGTREVILDISPKPVTSMKELTFAVSVIGGNPAPSLFLSLSMPGMYMGRNEVLLKKNQAGKYTGKGVIPRCPSGRRLWQAEVDVPGSGSIRYTFNVEN
jgi:hypothetical protein